MSPRLCLTLIGVALAGVACAAVEVAVDGKAGIRLVRIVREEVSGDEVQKTLVTGPEGSDRLLLTRGDDGLGREGAIYDFEHDVVYLTTYTSTTPTGDTGFKPLKGVTHASVGLHSIPGIEQPTPMLGVQIQRDYDRNRLELTVNGGLQTRTDRRDETPAATFRLLVYANLAAQEADTGGEGKGALFDGEVTLGNVITARDGFSEQDFVRYELEDRAIAAHTIGSVVKVVGVPDAATATVRVIASSNEWIPLSKTGVEAQASEPGYVTMLWTPRPNPARGLATFSFSVSRRSEVSLRVFDLQGRRVVTPLQGVVQAGPHDVTWNRLDARGKRVKSGIYFVRLEVEGVRFSRRLLLLN